MSMKPEIKLELLKMAADSPSLFDKSKKADILTAFKKLVQAFEETGSKKPARNSRPSS